MCSGRVYRIEAMLHSIAASVFNLEAIDPRALTEALRRFAAQTKRTDLLRSRRKGSRTPSALSPPFFRPSPRFETQFPARAQRFQSASQFFVFSYHISYMLRYHVMLIFEWTCGLPFTSRARAQARRLHGGSSATAVQIPRLQDGGKSGKGCSDHIATSTKREGWARVKPSQSYSVQSCLCSS